MTTAPPVKTHMAKSDLNLVDEYHDFFRLKANEGYSPTDIVEMWLKEKKKKDIIPTPKVRRKK